MPDLIKIGKTKRDSRSRARELYKTGVPTPFQVAFEIFCDNCDQVEKNIHKHLDDFRVNTDREFFKYPIDQAIILLQQNNQSLEEDIYSAIDITLRLKEKYPKWLKPDIASIRIVQPIERVWLEITQETEMRGNLIDQTIKRTDLGFISSNGGHFFSPQDSISINANKFLNQFDPYSIINTTDLFNEKAYDEILDKYNQKN